MALETQFNTRNFTFFDCHFVCFLERNPLWIKCIVSILLKKFMPSAKYRLRKQVQFLQSISTLILVTRLITGTACTHSAHTWVWLAPELFFLSFFAVLKSYLGLYFYQCWGSRSACFFASRTQAISKSKVQIWICTGHGSGSGSRSFPFLIKVLSGLK